MGQQDSKPQVNNRDRAPKERLKDDTDMMTAVMKGHKEGWTQITAKSIQYIRPTGYGFVAEIKGQYGWLAQHNGQARREGICTLIESAMQAVQNEVN